MLEGKLAVANFPQSCAMYLFENRVHSTSSRYKLATTNYHAQGFSIRKLVTASFPSNISMCVMLEGKLAFVQNRAHGTS